ncbi:hypothetical protein V8G54_009268 [Vigna mungo]|uniref:Uncharacterized protein n=1 Tax=Vigna mungo TaxID=3915 RepID=A0AAQ3NTN1_VIGMU
MKVKKAKRDLHTGEKKKRNREQKDEVEIQATVEDVEDEVVDNCHSSAEEIQDFGGDRYLNTGALITPCSSKKDKKKTKKDDRNSQDKGEGYNNHKEVYTISSVDDDC